MAQMTLPAEPAYKRTSYSKLLGADFSVDPSLVDSRHSPDLLNMISDNGGNPIKRPGWEVINHEKTGRISNLWSYYEQGKRYIAFTADGDPEGSLVILDENGEIQPIQKDGVEVNEIAVANGKHLAFYTEINDDQYGFYIMDGTEYHRIYVSEGNLVYEAVSPYVPTVIISRDPTGGGTQYEDINMLTRARKEQFLNPTSGTPATSTNRNFLLTAEVNTDKPWSLKYRDSNGEWKVDSGATVSGATVTASAAYTPVLAGQDNILIEYFAAGDVKGGEVLACTVSARFSATAQDQVFVSGNPTKRNYVYYSSPNDLTYFPDLNYMDIGGETAIMGFLNLGEYLAVVKEGTSYDSTIFMVYQTSISSKTVSSTDGSSTTTSQQTFAVKRATTGIGAISKHAFGVLNDEPVFLSPYGVHGVVSANILSEKVVRNRSYYLDKKLTEEDGLENAVACIWNNYYVCVVNNKAYILDGRHKSTDYSGNTNYRYEAYYWENIPAVSLVSFGKEFWFGTSDGRVCRFKNSGQSTDYSDGTIRGDDSVAGTPITATWSTPNDNDGQTEYFKKMMKKGSMCTVAPFNRSSVKVYIRVDGYPRVFIGMAYVDISGLFDGEIDFERLSFDARTTPRDHFFRKKQKKYKRLQIILENDELNEPFGIFEIVKTYVYQRFAK